MHSVMASPTATSSQMMTSHHQTNLRNEGGLQFIVLERPADAKSRKITRAVRSHVTTAQHRNARNAATAARVRAQPPKSTASGSAKVPKKEPLKGQFAKGSNPDEEQADEEVPRDWNSETTYAAETLNSGIGKSFSQGAVAFQTFILDDPENVVGRSLKTLRFDMSSLWVRAIPYT